MTSASGYNERVAGPDSDAAGLIFDRNPAVRSESGELSLDNKRSWALVAFHVRVSLLKA